MDWQIEPTTFEDMLIYCFLPSLWQTKIYFLLGLGFSVAQRALTYINGAVDKTLWRLTLLGIILLLSLFYIPLVLHILFLVLVTYLILYKVTSLRPTSRGPTTAIVLLAFMVVNEMMFNRGGWVQIRGIEMLIVMKGISLAYFFVPFNSYPAFALYMAYMLNPGTLLFGPFVTWNDFLKSLERYLTVNERWFRGVMNRCAVMLFYFFLTTCFIDFVFSATNDQYLLMYRDALNYRTSHYFICFFSEATALITGMGLEDDGFWFTNVTLVKLIEMPRSLVQVVTSWNIPTHKWLKQYIFRPTSKYGNVFAICMTYFVSSLLHGLNFRLAAVLMSLGLYTYVEYVFRAALAYKLNACIAARACHLYCGHRFRQQNLLVKLFNLALSLLAMFHLAYLGCLMATTDGIQDVGFIETFRKWIDLRFISLWIVLGNYGLYYVLRKYNLI